MKFFFLFSFTPITQVGTPPGTFPTLPTMEPRNVTLPQELVENSIGYLWSDPKTLKAACLVARAWVPACRNHLFRRVVLHWCDGGTRRSHLLYTLLLNSPSIPDCIREISVHEGLVSEHSQVSFCFAQSASLPNLLYLLPRLQLFEFRASALTHWSELSTELDRAVSHVATCPTLRELILGSWNFSSQPEALATILAGATKNVKTLSLTDIVTSVITENTYQPGGACAIRSGLDEGQISLESLSINDGALSLVPFCARWFSANLSSVRRLQLSCSKDQNTISALLRVLGRSLEDLELDIRALHGDAPINLQHNVRLRSFHLQASEHPGMSSHGYISIPWIVDTLSTMQSFEHLELLCMGLGIDADRLRRLSQSDSEHWRHLDHILSPKRYSRLRRVQIGIKFHCHSGSEYMEEARQSMYHLVNAGILDMYRETRRFCCIDYC